MSTDETTPPDAPTAPESDTGPAPALGIAEALKRGFADYLARHQVRPADGEELAVDLAFIKQHAGPLLAHLLRSTTQAMVPRDVHLSVSPPPPADEVESAPASVKISPAPVKISIDLGDVLSKLLAPPPKAPPG